MWLHHELVGVPLYNEPVVIQHHGPLHVDALQKALAFIVERHEAWRTIFDWDDGVLLGRVLPSVPVALPVIDLGATPAAQREAQIRRVLQPDLETPFDLSRPPLFRLRLFRLLPNEYRLYLTIHHIIVDGISLGQLFLGELSTAYRAFADGKELPDLPPLPLQYRDYARLLPTRTSEDSKARSVAYWTKQLAGPLPSTTLPLDKARPEIRTYRGATIPFSLDAGTTQALKDFARQVHASLPMILLATCHLALYRQNGETDQILGTVTSDRKQPETRNLLGLFLNTVVLRTRWQPLDSFDSLLRGVRKTMLDAMSHDVVPFSELVSRFERERIGGKSPLFQIMYAPQPAEQKVGSEWELSQMAVETGLSKFDLHLELATGSEPIWGRIHYSTELFRKETVEQFRDDWQQLTAAVPTRSGESIEALVAALPPLHLLESEEAVPKSFWQKLFRK